MRVVGTAGHVDHGKSTLVERLTGIDPDRLAEEKAREMTIDLGFAWLTLPSGETLGIVDVPGHRDFVENMLAGVGGIDAVLLVIAADEGVMPQTHEHLAIIDLLDIRSGLIVLTKTDLVDDPDWLELVSQEIADITQDTTLAQAEIVPVSARTGDGIVVLVEKLAALLNDLSPRVDYKHPRLPVDRVFTISGFGTVVTGTLLDGTLRVGEEIEIQPTGLRGRIRGLQSYQQTIEVAQPGSRVAANLSGIEKSAVARGHVLTHPGQLHPTLLLDARFRHLKDAPRPLKHHAEVKFFSGASEATARARLLGDESLAPGAEGWLQIQLQTPLPLAQGDRFILRYPSPGQTIGGGVVVNPHPGRRWRRFQPQVIQQLETRVRGTPAERVAQAAIGLEPVKRKALQQHIGLTDEELDSAIKDALAEGLLVDVQDSSYLARESWHALSHRALTELSAFHQAAPLRLGMSREELRSRLGIKQATLNKLLAANPGIVVEGNVVRLAEHQVQFNTAQTAAIQTLMHTLEAAPYTPPSYAEAAQVVGEDVLRALIDSDQVIQVQQDVIFARQAYEEMVSAVLDRIDADGSITAAALRDRFQTSRKYAIALLEHLDGIGVTRRVGETRVRGPRS